jgi:5-(carboxyamino)imidazole ribonucleotide synthase
MKVVDNWVFDAFDTRNLTSKVCSFDLSEEAPCKIACDKFFFKGDLMDF